ncbi:hypothetical protein VPH35_014773 [Triticum aestivum]
MCSFYLSFYKPCPRPRYHYQQFKIKIHSRYGPVEYSNYIELSNYFRFAVHVPPGTPACSTEGMVIMMYHWLHVSNGVVFCRPGDTAWTIIGNDNSINNCFVDFAYFDGKMFAMDRNCVTTVFDAMILKIFYQIDVPLATSNFAFRLCGGIIPEKLECLHLVALPHKLLLVKVLMESYEFRVFELASESEEDNRLAWRKVTEDEGIGNYDIFMDAYHATFSNSDDGSGTRIYHVDNELFGTARCVWGSCYNMHDNKMECIYEPPEDDYNDYYSTKPSWFVP